MFTPQAIESLARIASKVGVVEVAAATGAGAGAAAGAAASSF